MREEAILRKALLSVAIFIIVFFSHPVARCLEEDNFAIAIGAYSDKLFEVAAKEFKKYILKYPRSEKIYAAHFYLGECEFRLGHYSKAGEEYEIAVRAEELREKAAYMLAKCFLQEGQFQKAALYFEKLINNYPESEFSSGANYWLAETFFRKNDFLKAGEIYEELIKKYPDSPYRGYAIISSGRCLLKLGRPKDAVSSFKRFVSLFPDSRLAEAGWFWLGESHLRAGELKEAKSSFQKTLKNFPETEYGDDALLKVGLIYYKLQEYEEAIKSLEELASSFPESEYVDEAGYGIALVYESAGEYDNAVKKYAEVAEKFPESRLKPKALYRLASSYKRLGKVDEAGSIYLSLATDYPQSELAESSLFQVALQKEKSGKFKDAQAHYLRLLEEYPETTLKGAALLYLGNVYFSSGNFGEAGSAYLKLRNGDFLNQWREKAHYYYGITLFREKRYKEAVNELSLFAKTFPESEFVPEAMCFVGEGFYQLGKYGEAKSFFEKAAGSGDEIRHLSHLRAGDCLIKMGSLKEAITTYSMAKGDFLSPGKLRIGKALYNEKKFDAAIAVFDPLAASDNGFSSEARYWLGRSYTGAGELNKASHAYRDLIENFPGSQLLPLAFFDLGQVEYMQGNLQEAFKVYEKLRKLFPQAREADESYFWMGLCQFNLGNPDKGKELLELYESFSPELKWHGESKVWLARYSIEKREFEKARALLSALVVSSDKYLRQEAGYWLGRCFEAEEKYQSALTEYNKVVKNFPESARVRDAWMRIGDMWNLQEKYEKALAAYERALDGDEESQNNKEILFLMGKTLHKLGRHRSARGVLEKVRAWGSEEREAEIQFLIAECYRGTGELEEAILEYLKVVYLYPSSEKLALRAQEGAAICYEKEGRIDEASKIYRKISESDSDGVRGELARQRLKEIKSQMVQDE